MSDMESLRKKWCFLVVVMFCFWIFGAANVRAAEKDRFPSKTIKVIVPQSPGGTADAVPRAFVRFLSKRLGVDVVIENVPGAGGKMGLTKCWKADPNGYTLIYTGLPMSIMSEYLFQAEYKTREFTHIFGLLTSNLILLAHPDNWKTMDQLLTASREKTLSGGVPAIGTASHINGLVMGDKLGMKVNWVPYNSSGEVLAGVAGKHLDFGIISTDSAQTMAAAGKVRPLLVYSPVPDPGFPEVPFPEKLGYNMPTMSTIRGFIAPPKTPADRVKILSDAMFKAVSDPEFVDWAKKLRLDVTPRDGRKYLAETEKQYIILGPYRHLFKSQ